MFYRKNHTQPPDSKVELADTNDSSVYLFISFSATKWDGPWYVRQKLMSEISKRHKVVYVNQRKELREIISDILKLKNWKFIRKIHNNLFLIESPWIFPKIYKLRYLDTIIDWSYHRFIKLIAFLLGRDCIKIVYIWEPKFSSATRHFPKYKYIYHPYDLFEKYTYVRQKIEKWHSNVPLTHENDQALNDEKELVQNAFLFYSVTELLCDHYYNKFGRRPKLLPNAVQDIYFGRHDKKLQEEAKNILANLPAKKIGMSGSIKGSLDIDLIIDSSMYLEGHAFIFIGPIRYSNIAEYDDKIEKLFSLKNVFHLGPFNTEILPYLLRKMDALMMIYSNNQSIWTHFGGPAKLFEYMAIGKPIISTPHPAINEYDKYITIVENSKQFVSAVKRIEISSDDQLLKEMVQVAKKNTWKERERIILEDIRNNLPV